MKWNMIFGALVVSMGLCSQSFAGDLLHRMLGRGCGGCDAQCCETTCCEPEPACCEAEAACCEPEPACCEPEPACCEAEAACCEAEKDCCEAAKDCCDDGCGKCRRRCRIDLFAGLKGLFDCHRCRKDCCEADCCEAACGAEKDCCEAEKDCCGAEKDCCGDCDGCCKKQRCGLLANLFKTHHRCKKTCCNGCGNSNAAPAGDEAAPMPPAPMADPSASIQGKRSVVYATRSLVHRN